MGFLLQGKQLLEVAEIGNAITRVKTLLRADVFVHAGENADRNDAELVQVYKIFGGVVGDVDEVGPGTSFLLADEIEAVRRRFGMSQAVAMSEQDLAEPALET